MDYHGGGEEYKVRKKKIKRGSSLIFLIILRMLGRKSICEEGKGTKILGKNIKMKGTLYTPATQEVVRGRRVDRGR